MRNRVIPNLRDGLMMHQLIQGGLISQTKQLNSMQNSASFKHNCANSQILPTFHGNSDSSYS